MLWSLDWTFTPFIDYLVSPSLFSFTLHFFIISWFTVTISLQPTFIFSIYFTLLNSTSLSTKIPVTPSCCFLPWYCSFCFFHCHFLPQSQTAYILIETTLSLKLRLPLLLLHLAGVCQNMHEYSARSIISKNRAVWTYIMCAASPFLCHNTLIP